MKPKNDSSSSDSRESISNCLSKNEDSMSEFDDRSRSRSRSPGHTVSNSSKIKDHDAMSIYIGNVDYSATEDDLKNAFICCGSILRVTIIKNMKTGHPKGAAFIEFMHREGVQAAMKMNGTQVNGRSLTVTSKKPKPEKRSSRDRRDLSSYERRGPRSIASYYPYDDRSSYGYSSRGHYPGPPAYAESRRAHYPAHHIPFESQRMPRYDPYRRTDMYDSYMAPRGGRSSHLVLPSSYFHTQKYGSGHHSRSYHTPRYSNTFTRR